MKSNVNEVLLYNFPDRCKQTGHVFAVRPSAAPRIENGLQFLHNEGNISAAAEDCADHACERHRPGIVLQVLGIDEDLNGRRRP